MKIHADKIESDPPHALTVRDVRRLLKSIPPEWIAGLKTVRLTNSLELGPWAFFSRHDWTLTIYSRRGTAKQALTAILSELTAGALGLNNRGRHRRSTADKNRIGPLIQPYIDQLLPTLTPTKEPLRYPPTFDFKPMTFPMIDTDSSQAD